MTDAAPSFDTQRDGASRYLAAIREHWLLIVILVAVAVASAAAYSYTATKKYKAEAGAADKLVGSVLKGSTGKWGPIPMPPNKVTDEEAKTLVAWVLSL